MNDDDLLMMLYDVDDDTILTRSQNNLKIMATGGVILIKSEDE